MAFFRPLLLLLKSNSHHDAKGRFSHTGAKDGTVVAVKSGGTFNATTTHYLAKEGGWVEVGMPQPRRGSPHSLMVPGGRSLSDEAVAKAGAQLVHAPSGAIKSIYDLEAMPVGSKLKWRGNVYEKKSGSDWLAPDGKDYPASAMVGILDSEEPAVRADKGGEGADMAKAHNKGYFKDGKFIAPFDDKRASAKPQAPANYPPPATSGYKPPKWTALGSMKAKDAAKQQIVAPQYGVGPGKPAVAPAGGQGSLWGGAKSDHKPLPDTAVAHPRKGEKGETVMVHYPSTPSAPATWTDPQAIATFTPGCALPGAINGLALAPWADAPTTEEGWDYVEGQNDELEEPAMELPKGKVPASGVVVLEPDGRVWLVAPTNRFGSTKNTFPKGGRDYGLSLQANAIKEAYEESGLKVEIDSFLGDVVRSTSVGRYYLARRVGGTPADMGWESQAVRLVPGAQLREFMDRGEDKKIAEWLEGLV